MSKQDFAYGVKLVFLGDEEFAVDVVNPNGMFSKPYEGPDFAKALKIALDEGEFPAGLDVWCEFRAAGSCG